jgi:hypothetical protein
MQTKNTVRRAVEIDELSNIFRWFFHVSARFPNNSALCLMPAPALLKKGKCRRDRVQGKVL